MKNLYAVVVTYNGKKWYDRCFGSLLSSKEQCNVVVVDNASTDGSADYIKINFPNVYLIESCVNLGFARANNMGMRYAIDRGADFIFLLNQDAWIEQDTLTELLQTFKDIDDVGVASPVHLNGASSALDENFANYMGYVFTSDAFLNKLKHYYEVPFVNAAAWLVSAECVRRVGGFDTNLFFHYGEDNNYLQRVKYHGMKVVVNTHCVMCHDRENRKSNSLKFGIPNIQQHIMKIEKGNILVDIDMVAEIKSKKQELLKAYVGFHPKKIKRIKSEIQLLKSIQISRQYNQKGGEVWL